MKSFNLFPTLVKEYSVEDYPQKEKLLEIINNYSYNSHPLVKGGKSSFTKDPHKNNFLRINGFYDLEDYFLSCFQDYSNEIGIKLGVINNCWFNIMEQNNLTERHNHPGSSIVAAYYPLLEENTCNLILSSPIHPLQSAWWNTSSNSSENSYSSPSFSLKIKQNHLYIFPGWLYHSTEVNKGGKRIVISLNVSPWDKPN